VPATCIDAARRGLGVTGATARRLVRVEGRVQGVGFREACVRQARALAVHGWVRNRLDGSLEALLHGPAEPVERLTAWLREGPPAARVDRVTWTDAPAGAEAPVPFERRPTA
jgi:acylphosphatase